MLGDYPMQQALRIKALCNTLRPLRERLVVHEVYTCVETLAVACLQARIDLWDGMVLQIACAKRRI